jgi:hypothetical protein
MVAFHTPLSAVWWCIFVQQALMEADWPAKLLTSPNSAEEFAGKYSQSQFIFPLSSLLFLLPALFAQLNISLQMTVLSYSAE